MAPALPVARSSEDLLVTSAGEPVWPLRGEAGNALRAIARTFGASLAETEAVAGTAFAGREVVLGIGEQNAAGARLYAHLTRRQPRVVAALEEVPELGKVKVVICQWSQLDFSALHRLHAHGRSRGAIGLIVGHDPGSMRTQLLTRAAAASLPGTDELTASVIYADWGGEERRAGSLHLLGTQAGRGAFRRALSRGANVVSVNGHGDGLDMQLGTRETLCGVLGREASGAADGAPDCVAGRYCYRKHLPLDQALSSGDLIDPGLLRCRVGIFNSCFTIPARGALVAPRWSLLARWLDSPSVGAVLAPFGLSVLPPPARLDLVQAVLIQDSVGTALERFNRSEAAASGRIRLCLFGDPRTCVVPEPAKDAEGPRRKGGRRPKPPRPRAVSPGARADLLRRAVAEARRTADEDAARALDEAAALLQEAPLPQALPAALRGLLQCDSIWHLFPRLASSAAREVPELQGRCAACGESARVYRFPFEGGLARLQAQCDRCGVTSDVEEGSELLHATFSLEGGGPVLPERLRRPEVHAGLKLRPWHRKNATWKILSPPGETRPRVVPAPGLTSAHVLALDGGELIFLRRLIRVEGPLEPPAAATPGR